MVKKRKSNATRLDEVDRTMYNSFCNAANSLSQLYAQSMNHQRQSFQAGERHALEKLYQWILRCEEEGSRVTKVDIVAYLQNELGFGAEEPSMSPRVPYEQHTQNNPHMVDLNAPDSSNTLAHAPAPASQGLHSTHSDHQAKNSVFSNALSGPLRRSIQEYHMAHGSLSNAMATGNVSRNVEINYPHQPNRECNPTSSNDSMDMHSDSPVLDIS